MDMDIIGKLYRKGQVQTRGANGFQFREFIIEVSNPQNPQWNNYVPFQVSGNSLNTIDNFNEGDELQVTFDIRGRMWTNPQGEERCIMNLQAWRIGPYNPQMQQGGMAGGYQTQQPFQQPYQQQPFQQQPYQQPMGNFSQPMGQQPMQQAPASMPDAGDSSGLPF